MSRTFHARELNMSARIIAILCIDADPDRPEYGGMRYDCRDKLSWRQLPELATKIATLRASLFERFGVKLRLTWFIRADSQIREIHGNAAWSIKEFEGMWNELSRAGDELAWHPHAWRWSDARNCWYNETVDTAYMLESFDVGFEAFRKGIGRSPASSRVGINFHNNSTMGKLDSLGVKADLSGHPGLKLFYARPEVGGPVEEGFDWSRTNPEPYHPARDDYQRPSKDRSLNILEIPVTTWHKAPNSFDFWKGLVPIRLHGGIGYVRPAVKGWFIPSVWGLSPRFELGLTEVLRRAKKNGIAHYASSMHPDDISDASYHRLRSNLEYMIGVTDAKGINLDFVTASQARGYFPKS